MITTYYSTNNYAGYIHTYIEIDNKYVFYTDLNFNTFTGNCYFGNSKSRCVITRTIAARHDTWYCTYYVKGEYYASANQGLSNKYIPTINIQFQLGNPATGDRLYYRNAPVLFVFEE